MLFVDWDVNEWKGNYVLYLCKVDIWLEFVFFLIIGNVSVRRKIVYGMFYIKVVL